MSGKKSLFLGWWLLFSVLNLGIVGLAILGFFDKVNNADITKLSFFIFILFYLATLRNGVIVFKIDKYSHDELCLKNEPNWYLSNVLLALGMLGTVIGFIFLFSGVFRGFTLSDQNDMQRIIALIGEGAGTALYTTMSGLVARVLLRFQAFIIEYYITSKAIKAR